jgi:Na+/serine symporter
MNVYLIAQIAAAVALGLVVGWYLSRRRGGAPALFTWNIRDVIGLLLIVCFMAATGWLLNEAIPRENEQLVAYMLGQLSGFVAGVVAYHYVSKAGEKELDQLRTENTGKALDALAVAAGAAPPNGALNTDDRPAGTHDDPVHTTEEEQP